MLPLLFAPPPHSIGTMPVQAPSMEATPSRAGHRSQAASLRTPLLLATAAVLLLGVVDALYGNTDSGDVYGSDAVQYLDIARALARHDWRSALNPLWSQGYPALLACVHLVFPFSPAGDWWTTRITNVLGYAAGYAAFLFLLFTLAPLPSRAMATARTRWLQCAGACILAFVAAQTCLGQVSRVGPDEFVTALFLLACALLVRLLRRASWTTGVLFGLTLGTGFLVKAAWLPLGLGMLAVAAVASWRRRVRLLPLTVGGLLFLVFVLAYGIALSHAVGYRTLGEAGSLNYAWHVDRLQKWVHWQGGVQPAAEAWPSPRLARAAQWNVHPPDFGTPVHPSRILQESPRVYGFAAPVRATYLPYFDPPFFYQGYRRVFRWRYQAIALGKNLGDLLQVLLKQPLAWALFLVLALTLRDGETRDGAKTWLQAHWPVPTCALLGIMLFLPVHLEGRYIAGMLLVLAVCTLLALNGGVRTSAQLRGTKILLLLGFAAELAVYQGPVGRNLLHHRMPAENAEWRMGTAALAQGLPRDAAIGVIAWTPSLHCDWAYLAHLRIVSEIADGPSYDVFWHSSPREQAETLQTFRRSGAVAVFVQGKPAGLGGPQWQQLNDTPLWMLRL